MTDNRKNLKIDPETFEALKDSKPPGVTWDYYLEQLQYSTDAEEPTNE